MRLGFFLRESMRAMRRNAAPSFAALITVVVTLIVVGVFIPIVQATRGEADSVRGRVFVAVYMKTGATRAQDSRVDRELLAVPHVKRVVFVPKAEALAQQKKLDPAAYDLLSGNPLPDSFDVYPDNPANVLLVRSSLQSSAGGGSSFIDPAINSISNKRTETRRLLEVTNLVTITAAVLSVLLTLASILLIANTIRLSLFARRREVEVMKLVGATDWFIRWPFVIEGTLVGAAGALVAIAVLGVAKLVLLNPLADNWRLIAAPQTIAFPVLVVVLVAAGVLVSALGSGISLRRFLRI